MKKFSRDMSYPESTRGIRILIVDDHRAVREGIRMVIGEQPSIHIIGEAENGVQAIAVARALVPDVILMDITMPVMDGLEATKRISTEVPSCRILILSQHNEERYQGRAKTVGAAGFLHKSLMVSTLHPAIRMVATGGQWFACGRE